MHCRLASCDRAAIRPGPRVPPVPGNVRFSRNDASDPGTLVPTATRRIIITSNIRCDDTYRFITAQMKTECEHEMALIALLVLVTFFSAADSALI